MDLDNGYHRNASDFNNKILVTAIISLSVVVILITILHIYARHVLRRQARRRAALRHISFMATSEAQPGRNQPKGLHPAILASLPILVFRHMDGEDESKSQDCAVCLSGLEDGEFVKLLPNCKHNFHVECIDKWLGSHSTCPVCRNEAEPKLVQPEPREPMIRVPSPSGPSTEMASHAMTGIEVGTSDGTMTTIQASAKVTRQSSSRLSSFRRMLSRDRSSRRIQACAQEVEAIDLERQ